MKVEEKIIAENTCQARNLFQSEFTPQLTSTEETAELIRSKLYGEFGQATKHFE
jgi:hypothetical protein